MKTNALTKLSQVILFLLISFTVKAQTDTLYYINSSFETTEDQSKWNSYPSDPNIKWTYGEGGNNYPLTAKSGTKNAIFYWNSPTVKPYRLLSSNTIDLSTAEKPELTFWHAQAASVFGQDELYILFGLGNDLESTDWDTIASYTNRIDDWTSKIFNVDEVDEKYLAENFRIGFLGHANGGQGVCVDSVVLKETAIIDKFVKNIAFTSVNHSIITSKMKEIPIIRVYIEVMGNNAELTLNNMEFNLGSGEESYFKSNGFRLFHTTNQVFRSEKNFQSTQVGSEASISDGKVTFTSINKVLELGDNYIWLTADFSEIIEHNSAFSFGVGANSIQISDTLLPVTASPNIINTTIKEGIYYTNFSSTLGWTLEEDFEIDEPLGLKTVTSADPSYAYSGDSVLGTDLTTDGMYIDGINESTAYHAISPEFDLTYYDAVKIYMRKWIDFEPTDRASMSVSTDDGNTWKNIWHSHIDNPAPSSEWEELLFSIRTDTTISRHDSVRFRFSVLDTDAPFIDPMAGFNIDNFTVSGNHLETDVGITAIYSPYNDCIGSGNDTVKVTIRNYAESASPATIPVYFGLWGTDSILVHDTIHTSIAKDDSITFTFSTLANFPHGDYYDEFIVGVNMEGDEDATNDELNKPLFIQDSYIPPITLDFDYKGDLWIPSAGSQWDYQIPDGSIPPLPDGTKSWILSPYGPYPNNNLYYLTSNCYDMTFEDRHIIGLDYWLDSEPDDDGFALEYSVNDGETWELIDSTSYNSYWNWYNSEVISLGHIGWSGISGGWQSAKELLPASLAAEPKVKFRIVWDSDESVNARGLAIDNFTIYPAPPDVGVSAITIPLDTCQFILPDTVEVYVKNFGYNSLKENDTIIIGVDFEEEDPEFYTFLLENDLAAGDSIMFALPKTLDVDDYGFYDISAYTLIEDDPWFYSGMVSNDTLSKTFEIWQNPITNMLDTISSRRPDTVAIEPYFDPSYSYLWGDSSTDPVYDVNEPGTYYLTVTESGHGCQTHDSIFIELLFNDVGIDSIIWPQSSCELSSAENIQVQIRNTGTDSLIIGDKIFVYYNFNEEGVVKDSIELDEAFYSGTYQWFTFEDYTVDMESIGDYDIKAYVDFGGDTIPENDTIIRTITVFGYPALELGNDTIIQALSYTLNVDPTFDIYLWMDGDTSVNRVIDSSGYYWLDILDINGCPASDSIDIWFKIRDVRPQSLLTPLSACERESTDQVSVRINNYGTDTVLVSDNITVSYKMDDDTRVEDIINVRLLPGESYDHEFTPVVDLIEFGEYDFNLTATTAGDLRSDNDTLDLIVYTNENPVVDLGVDEEEVYKVTELLLDAGYGEHYTYLWQDGSTNQTYTVTNITTVAVLVTDTITGCYGGDTASVYLDILDYLVYDISIEPHACVGIYDDITVDILNNGNLPRGGADLVLDFYSDSEFLFTESFNYSGSWAPSAIKTYSVQNSIDLNEYITTELGVAVTHTEDLRRENDTLSQVTEVVPYPDIDLGGPNLEVTLPYILDPGSGYAEYLWNDESTEPALTVTQPGTYSVTVTSEYGCASIETVIVNGGNAIEGFFEDNLNLIIFPNPADEVVNIEAEMNIPGEYILEIYNSQNSLFILKEILTTELREEIYIGDLSPGMYFIRIRNEEILHIGKLIIE
ncbi:MAG: T9SS type A sorting domain-containing protein [Bacteroidales bacterium]|nr:T9SS type A sorting domain-containing protein [Bacteroidales bacterium]